MWKHHNITLFLLIGLFCLGTFHPSPQSQKNSDSSDSDSDSNEHGVVETEHKTNCSCGWANKDDQRIVGGKVTKENEYPMIAGFVLFERDMVICGGTILTERHILTAAHCTEPFSPTDYGIFVGHNNYEKVKHHHELMKPLKFIEHEKFDPFTLKYDVALVVIKKPLKFNKNIGPACLPKTTDLDLVSERVKVLGWGLTRYKGQTSEILLKVNVDVQTFETCIEKNMHLELDDRHQLCTFRPKKDSCSGDSGGPLLWRDELTNRYTLIAAVSYGTNCAKYPAVNSQVTFFLPWIQKKISETDPTVHTCARN